MRKLNVFNFITLNGYFKGPVEDISWHRHGDEESAFAEEGAQSQSVILFGRKTYEMMAGYWPTPQAMKDSPEVADGMNKSEKIVFSRSLTSVNWKNTRLIKDNIVEAVRELKESPGNDLIILGSGSIITQLATAGLIDAYQFMVDPVVLGDGSSTFKGLPQKLDLKLTKTKTFQSGVVLLCYQPL